ncbi:hypothetical protein CVT26_000509 [Gymnopilus dilepis]|uniref:Uncharacterized protein n=1 Tax=Gymnopilus dilepis TaxID=231916 RepID=A0A409VH05_9AGAR|nr:hypothetical protein CVT26_000509 [Gymnopilus dilepis]
MAHAKLKRNEHQTARSAVPVMKKAQRLQRLCALAKESMTSTHDYLLDEQLQQVENSAVTPLSPKHVVGRDLGISGYGITAADMNEQTTEYNHC